MNVADVHARPLPDGFQTFEDSDARTVVVRGRDGRLGCGRSRHRCSYLPRGTTGFTARRADVVEKTHAPTFVKVEIVTRRWRTRARNQSISRRVDQRKWNMAIFGYDIEGFRRSERLRISRDV